jgi:hypothetical protein
MPLLEQASRFKFSLSIDGKAAPWRLALQLPLESTIIRQDGGPFGEFFDDRLKPMEHYIPLNLNLSNIAEQVHVCTRDREREREAEARAVQHTAEPTPRSSLERERYLSLMIYIERGHRERGHALLLRTPYRFPPSLLPHRTSHFSLSLSLSSSHALLQAAWAIANDAAAHNITRNARLAAKEILSLDALVCHTSTGE